MIEFNVNGQEMTRLDDSMVVQNSYNHLTAEFTFSSEWDELIKFVVLASGKMSNAYALTDNVAKIPHAFLTYPKLHISAFGISQDNSTVLTTNIIDILLTRSGYTMPGAPGDNDNDAYTEMRSKIDEMYANQPEITVSKNTDDEYTLNIKSYAGEFETPNLKGEDGVDGDAGVYATAVKYGYKGTEEEFNQALADIGNVDGGNY